MRNVIMLNAVDNIATRTNVVKPCSPYCQISQSVCCLQIFHMGLIFNTSQDQKPMVLHLGRLLPTLQKNIRIISAAALSTPTLGIMRVARQLKFVHAQCLNCYSQHYILFCIVMLNVIMLRIVMLNVVMLSDVYHRQTLQVMNILHPVYILVVS